MKIQATKCTYEEHVLV